MGEMRDKHEKELHNLHFSCNIYLIKSRIYAGTYEMCQ